MWEQAIQTFTEFAGLPELLVDFGNVDTQDSSPLSWVEIFNADTPHFDSVVDFQEHMHETGFKLQLELLKSDSPNADMGIQRIGEMVTLVNNQVLENDTFLDQKNGPAALGRLNHEMEELLKMEFIKAMNKGPVFVS